MSGGKDRRSRASKTQGWEEAGGEFYQESYPADLEGMQRDPSKIATLLPSKQTRNATTRRVRPSQQDTKGTRRRTSFSTVARRGSQYHEIQVATLPDLSENLINEERTWEEIQEIKSMPVPMAQKREMKAQLQNATKLRLQGFEQIKWRRRKAWQSIRSKWSEYRTKLELWRMSLKTIEGNFGTGVVAYFLFLRWLMFLNLIVFGLVSMFIVLPHVALKEPQDLPCEQQVDPVSVQCCSESYVNATKNAEFSVLDVIQGTGFMEGTLLFYGMYTNMIYGYSPAEDRMMTAAVGTSIMSSVTTTMIMTTMAPSSTAISGSSNKRNSNISTSASTSTSTSTGTSTTEATTTPMGDVVIGEIRSSNFSVLNESFFDALVMETEEAIDQSKAAVRSHTVLYYDFPLVYVIITAICYVVALIAIMKAVVRQFKDRIAEGEGLFYQYCNLVFGGWDFCIHNEKSADVKHKALYNEIRSLIHMKRFENERINRSRDFMVKLMAIRFLINFVVVVILITAVVIIYVLFNESMSKLDPNFQPNHPINLPRVPSWSSFSAFGRSATMIVPSTSSTPPYIMISQDFSSPMTPSDLESSISARLEVLFYEFLPYLAIVCMNLVVPLLFNYLVQFEKYSPLFVIKISLFRTVFLRLSSLAVLLSRFYFLVNPKVHQLPANSTELFSNYTIDSNSTATEQCHDYNRGTPPCWETFVGQQFYKLFIVDFVTHFLVTFFVNFPRAMFARHSSSRFAKFIGEQEFELSKHVLDVIYSQTLCWLGTFYTPFLPAIAAVLFFLMFYIKKFACLVNSNPSTVLYRASRSNSLFMSTLLISFTVAIIPVVYAWAEIIPSRSCGPFRGLPSVWDRAINAFMKMPLFFQNIIFYFGTASFAIPCFVVLTFFIYYYYAVSAANRHMVSVLKHQLVLEGHDKQFLLSRLSLFIKQQQEYQKRMMRQAIEQQQQQQQLQGNNVQHPPPPVAPPKPPQLQQQQQQQPEQQPPLPPRADRDSKPSSRDRDRKENGSGEIK
ncbi:transmembrane channel-like protein 7 [Toxorhynchites rutilus septentrionalis]|uniref:transmembrane channel-like protein 7 n=1 Tax=Toxorhynchites rutilus septentrionalis TaxID=329112 RepID=UPI002479CF1E|nr:transmembrane channel-like protein 7 [Toxorhynchites rutilus septentrionalis]